MTRAPDTSRAPAPSAPTRSPAAPGPRTGLSELAAAIRTALAHLTDLHRPSTAVTDGGVEAMLRATLDGPDLPGPSAAAVRTACAHLAAEEYEDAYLALRTATDHLPRRSAALPGHDPIPG